MFICELLSTVSVHLHSFEEEHSLGMYMQLVPSKGKHTNIVFTRNDLSVKLKAVANGTSIYYSIYIISLRETNILYESR